MSKLIVEVCAVSSVEDHPNADRMKIATVKGWRTCVGFDPVSGKGQFAPGDACVYVPPDSVITLELAERLGVRKHLAPVLDREITDPSAATHYRVRAARLRGVASYGLVFAPEDPRSKVGDNVADFYGITKWEPPLSVEKDADVPHPAFHRYTDIQAWANYPDEFKDNEEVVITEKIHGLNCRIGLVRAEGEGEVESRLMAGSFSVPRLREYDGNVSVFWKAIDDRMKRLLAALHGSEKRNIVVFGEVFGSGLQDTAYGLTKGESAFRLIDIAIDQQYMDFDEKAVLCLKHGIEMVPVLYRGPYEEEVVRALTDGPTTLCSSDKAGRFKGREGIVISPTKERLSSNFDRLILKCVSADFLARSGGTDAH